MKTPVAPLWTILNRGDAILEKLTGLVYYVTDVCPSRIYFDTGAAEPEWVRTDLFHNEFSLLESVSELAEGVAA